MSIPRHPSSPVFLVSGIILTKSILVRYFLNQHPPNKTMARLNAGNIQDPRFERVDQHLPFIPTAYVQEDRQDECASDTDTTEYTQNTKCRSAKHLISSWTFVKGLLIDVVSVLVSTSFLVFAIVGILSKNNEIGQREVTLLNAARIVS